MSRKCTNCQYSWGGFTDHSLEESVHFNSEEERYEYYRNIRED